MTSEVGGGVTVAVCTRNRATTIGDCLASLVSQEHPANSYEVVLVDDGSTDATPDIAKEFIDRPGAPAFRYIRQDHGGLSIARNRAVQEARGSLICFIDDDAIASPGWVGALVDGATRHPDIECFAGRIVLQFEGDTPRTCERESIAAELDIGNREMPVRRAKGANMAIRRSAFERIGLFNPALMWRGDEENWQGRLEAAGGSIVYLPRALIHHRRLASDLKPTAMLRARFRWGKGRVPYLRESGLRFSSRRELSALGRALAHLVTSRCFGGALDISFQLGCLWGAATGGMRQPRREIPLLESGRRS